MSLISNYFRSINNDRRTTKSSGRYTPCLKLNVIFYGVFNIGQQVVEGYQQYKFVRSY